MKGIRTFLALLLITGTIGLAGTAGLAQENVMRDGVMYSAKIPGTNFCHLMFPKIDPMTLFTDKPALESPKAGNLLDFYGACDYDPLGKREVASQRADFSVTHRSDVD